MSTCSIKLINKSHRDVAFQVKTTHPKKYCVRPNLGLISAGSTCVVQVSLQAQKITPIGTLKKDQFLINSVVVEKGDKLRNVTSDMFRNKADNDVQGYRLRVVFVSANRPSPIPEASEEDLDSYQQKLCQDSHIARVTRDKRLEEWTVISKLMEEKYIAHIQTKKLHSELEMFKKQQRQGGNSRLFLVWLMLVNIIGLMVGYTFG